MKRFLLAISIGLCLTQAQAAEKGDYLVKFKSGSSAFKAQVMNTLPANATIRSLDFQGWHQIKLPATHANTLAINALSKMPGVEYIQPNYKVHLLENPTLAAVKAQIQKAKDDGDPCPIPGLCGDSPESGGGAQDNPPLPGMVTNPGRGADPLFSKQWGMNDIGVSRAWTRTMGRKEVIVAVIDTGVDYTHEDLVENLWRNPGETGTDAQGRDKATNGVDDDNNGYVDDVIGWDFVSNDNKPYDLAKSGFELLQGGNPGHGTHCSGNVAARGGNGKGVAGVAPNVSIMALRFISDSGEGTTDAAIAAMKYAIANGASVTSNSWGSEGEDPNDGAENRALRDAIQLSQDHGVLFVAAAGNGHNGVGYNNDTDAKPGYPASYDNDIIVSVAAIDVNNALGSFSNWGVRSVDIAAPGVKVFSTTVGSHYDDTVLNFPPLITATWDGTSMATPHVAGAAALYLSAHPEATWRDIKAALIRTAMPISAMTGKSVSGGKLNVEKLLME